MQALIRASFLAATLLAAGQATAATCRDPAGFEKWLDDIGQEAVAQGISPEAVKQGLSGVTFDQSIIRKDRGQGVFKQSFEQFAGRMVSPARLKGGANMLKRHAATLSRIEQRFGVPAPVLVAIWGLETDFGAVKANLPVIRSVATLAYDCRRTDFFTGHLFDALRIVDRATCRLPKCAAPGPAKWDRPSSCRRPTSNTPSISTAMAAPIFCTAPADVLASTANYLKGHGWVKGGDWQPGSPNFEAIRAWNKSQVYSRTIAFYASKLAGSETSAAASQ